jgi:flagellar hook-associated protein 2
MPVSNLRIGGLASGMDIDQIVSDLMKAERMPLDKLTQKKQYLEWQRDDYREMNTLLQSLDQTIFNNVYLQRSFNTKKVSSSNENAVSAVAINSVSNVSNTIEVVNLATAASWKAAGDVKIDKPETPSIFETVDGTIKAKAETELKFKVKDPGADTYRDVAFKIYAGDSIDTVISRINSSGLGVSAMRAKLADGGTYVIFTSNKTGANGEIVASDDATKTFLNDLGFDMQSYKLEPINAGADALIKLNGYQMTQTSNTFTINGIQYTIKSKTDAAVTVSTSTDVDAIFNSIKTFVDKYNEVIEKINKKLKEERYRDYTPLTDKQKEAMTEKQVEKWEEKARSGLLRNDSILSRALSSMRMDLYTRVGSINSDYDQLSKIGIKTSSNYLEGGKLIIDDEAKLKEAIEKDPNAVYQLFANDGTDYQSKGLARRLRDTIKKSMDSIVEKAGNSLKTNQQFSIGKLLINVDSQINRFEDRLTKIEDRYWRQFTAMEKAIQRSNEQMAFLMQRFGGN